MNINGIIVPEEKQEECEKESIAIKETTMYCDFDNDNDMNWEELYFYTRQDCDTVVSILARNGYSVAVDEVLVSPDDRRWKLMYRARK